jgi:hypothetical protein
MPRYFETVIMNLLVSVTPMIGASPVFCPRTNTGHPRVPLANVDLRARSLHTPSPVVRMRRSDRPRPCSTHRPSTFERRAGGGFALRKRIEPARHLPLSKNLLNGLFVTTRSRNPDQLIYRPRASLRRPMMVFAVRIKHAFDVAVQSAQHPDARVNHEPNKKTGRVFLWR